MREITISIDDAAFERIHQAAAEQGLSVQAYVHRCLDAGSPDANLLAAGLVECFDVAIPHAAPWTGTFQEKAEYAAKVLPEHLRGLQRLRAKSSAASE